MTSSPSRCCGSQVTLAEDHFARSSSATASADPAPGSSAHRGRPASRAHDKFMSLSKPVLAELAGSQENMLKKYREALSLEKEKARKLERKCQLHEQNTASVRVALLSASAEQRALEKQLRSKVEALSAQLSDMEDRCRDFAAIKRRASASSSPAAASAQPTLVRPVRIARNASTQCDITRVNAPWVEVESPERTASSTGYTQLYETGPSMSTYRRSVSADERFGKNDGSRDSMPLPELESPVIRHLLKCWEEATSYGPLASKSRQEAGEGSSVTVPEKQLNAFLKGVVNSSRDGSSLPDSPTKCLIRLFGQICRGRMQSKHIIELNHLPKEISEGFLLHLFPLLEAHRPDVKVRAHRRVRNVYDVKLSVEAALPRLTSRRSFGGEGRAVPLAPSPTCKLCQEMFFYTDKDETERSAWQTFNTVNVYEYCLRCAKIVESVGGERADMYRQSTLITKEVVEYQRRIQHKVKRAGAMRRSKSDRSNRNKEYSRALNTPPRPSKNHHKSKPRLAVIE